MDRFWSKVNKDGPTMPHMDSPCWEWTGSKHLQGYGRQRVEGKIRLTHRLSALYAGIISDIDDGDCVCHSCDNPVCVNPDHLWRGSQIENTADRHQKGRDAKQKGSDHGKSKLSEKDIFHIKNLLKAGASQTNVAKKFGVTRSTICHIASGRTWRHV